MSSCIAVQKPFLSTQNIGQRIHWDMEHKDWTMIQWSTVMFADEFSFTVLHTKNRLRVWRKPGMRLHQRHIIPTYKSG